MKIKIGEPKERLFGKLNVGEIVNVFDVMGHEIIRADGSKYVCRYFPNRGTHNILQELSERYYYEVLEENDVNYIKVETLSSRVTSGNVEVYAFEDLVNINGEIKYEELEDLIKALQYVLDNEKDLRSE